MGTCAGHHCTLVLRVVKQEDASEDSWLTAVYIVAFGQCLGSS